MISFLIVIIDAENKWFNKNNVNATIQNKMHTRERISMTIFSCALFFVRSLLFNSHSIRSCNILQWNLSNGKAREKKKISQINEWNGKRNYSNWNWIRQYVRPQLNSLFCARRFFFCHLFFISKLLNCLQQLRYHYPICVQSKCKHTHLFTWTENKRKQTIHQFHCID